MNFRCATPTPAEYAAQRSHARHPVGLRDQLNRYHAQPGSNRMGPLSGTCQG